MQHKNWNGATYCKAETRQVGVGLLQPVIEILGIVRGIPLSVGGHAEHSQGLVDLREATQVRLQPEERRNFQGSHNVAVGQFLFPQRRCANSTTRLQKGLGKAKPTQNCRENKANHPHWTASQYIYPTRKAMGFSMQGFKGPGECRMARTEPVSASLRLILSPLNDTTVPWPGSLDYFRGAERLLLSQGCSGLNYQVILLWICCHAPEAVAMGIFGEAIGKLLCCARLGTVENHYIPPLERKKNPFSMVISHLANAWMKHRQRKCLGSGILDCNLKATRSLRLCRTPRVWQKTQG